MLVVSIFYFLHYVLYPTKKGIHQFSNISIITCLQMSFNMAQPSLLTRKTFCMCKHSTEWMPFWVNIPSDRRRRKHNFLKYVDSHLPLQVCFPISNPYQTNKTFACPKIKAFGKTTKSMTQKIELCFWKGEKHCC